MRAAVMRAVGEPLVVQDVDVDVIGAREVLVDIKASGVCHSDVGTWQGSAATALPTVLGHEPAGVVVAVGPDVDYVMVGDHVVGTPAASCGQCEFCVSGRPFLCGGRGTHRDPAASSRLSLDGRLLNQFVGLSGFAEQILVHEAALVRLDPDMPLTPASLLGCGAMTGLGAAFRTARLRAGDQAAVIGLGGVGLSAVQGCRLAGARRIVAIDTNPTKLALALELGATDAVLATENAPAHREVLALTRGGVDWAFECVGSKPTLRQAFAMTRTGGTTVLVGAFQHGQKIELPGSDFIMRGKTLKGSSLGGSLPRVDIPLYVDLYLAGRLKLDEMVSDLFTLDTVNEAFRRLIDGELARGVITSRQ